MLSTSLLLLAAVGAQSAMAAKDQFILTMLSSIAVSRLDPIINPGKVSGHVHNIMGGSGFHESINSVEDQQASDCSSAIIGDDKSNYWSPHLYYQYENGTFAPMLGGNRIYYFMKGDVKPFPPGLRMISGLAVTRNASDEKSLGVKISCNHGLQTQYLPNGTSHPEGCGAIAMGIFFPSCGLADGTLDSPDHFSHMAWPYSFNGPYRMQDPNGRNCPETHPIKYPSIFFEANYYPTPEQPWHSGNPLILSNGDQSGLGYHADFIDGWNQQTLKDTLAQCGEGKAPGEGLQNCAPLAKSYSAENSWNCRLQGRIPNEDVGYYRPIDKLPGCNKVWPTDAEDVKPACEETDPPALLYPNVQFVNLKFRTAIPTFSTLVENTTDRYAMGEFIPGLGANGASSFKAWGYQGSNEDNLRSSTIEEILNTAGGQDAPEPLSAPSSSASADAASNTASSAAAAKTSALRNTGVNLADPDAEEEYDAVSSSSVPPVVSSAILSAVASSSASHVSSVANVATSSSSVSAAAAATSVTKPSGRTCKGTKRGLQRSREVGHEVKLHVARRSRRNFLGH